MVYLVKIEFIIFKYLTMHYFKLRIIKNLLYSSAIELYGY